MSGVKKDQEGVEEEREEEWGWGWEGDSRQWMIDRKNDVICYEKALASGKFNKFSKLDWIRVECMCAYQLNSLLNVWLHVMFWIAAGRVFQTSDDQ